MGFQVYLTTFTSSTSHPSHTPQHPPLHLNPSQLTTSTSPSLTHTSQPPPLHPSHTHSVLPVSFAIHWFWVPGQFYHDCCCTFPWKPNVCACGNFSLIRWSLKSFQVLFCRHKACQKLLKCVCLKSDGLEQGICLSCAHTYTCTACAGRIHRLDYWSVTWYLHNGSSRSG